MGEPTLYHSVPSFSSQIARMVLAEKGIAWKGREVDLGPAHENFEPWYLRLNSKGVVPTLEHDGRVVTDAIAIARYLDDAFDGPKLVPADPAARKAMEDWIHLQQGFDEVAFSFGTLKDDEARAIRADMKRRPKLLAAQADANPDLREAYQAKIHAVQALRAKAEDAVQIEILIRRLEELLDRLGVRARDHEWLTDAGFTLADVAWTVLLARAEALGFDYTWTGGARPAVEAYYTRAKARPSFATAQVGLRPHPKGGGSWLATPAARIAAGALLAGLVAWGVARLL